MTLPWFAAGNDPGPSFSELLRATGTAVPVTGDGQTNLNVTHGTTIVAIKYADGVVMAGDRRATQGFSNAPPGHAKGVSAHPFSRAFNPGGPGPALGMVAPV